MALMINILLDRIKQEFSDSEPKWERADISDSDMRYLTEECNKTSEFDETNKRKKMYDEMIKGNKVIVKSKCQYGELITIFDKAEQMAEMPWGLWARILRLFSENNKKHKPFKVFFLADTSLRKFPKDKEPIKPENINGGYTYRCDHETILIYRAEDATRVLIHELQHSCCLDKIENGVDLIEAETEAWAELFYIAILSKGHKNIFDDLLKKQSAWIISQNKKVRQYMNNPNSMEFPWRYTLGKEEVWRRWGILNTQYQSISLNNSLRLTYPPSQKLKEEFKVLDFSVIL
jgi:hypothetical protein